MSSSESRGFIKSKEGTIGFDRESRCALIRGFEQNQAVVRELKKIVEEREVEFFAKILSDSVEDRYIISDEMKTIYGQVAKRELERIDAEDEDDDDLLCGHSVEEHQEALRSVVEKMEPAVN